MSHSPEGESLLVDQVAAHIQQHPPPTCWGTTSGISKPLADCHPGEDGQHQPAGQLSCGAKFTPGRAAVLAHRLAGQSAGVERDPHEEPGRLG